MLIISEYFLEVCVLSTLLWGRESCNMKTIQILSKINAALLRMFCPLSRQWKMPGCIYCLALGSKEFYCNKNVLCKDDSKNLRFLNMITKLTKNRPQIWLQEVVVGAVPRRIYDGFCQATKRVRNALSFCSPCSTVSCLQLNV